MFAKLQLFFLLFLLSPSVASATFYHYDLTADSYFKIHYYDDRDRLQFIEDISFTGYLEADDVLDTACLHGVFGETDDSILPTFLQSGGVFDVSVTYPTEGGVTADDEGDVRVYPGMFGGVSFNDGSSINFLGFSRFLQTDLIGGAEWTGFSPDGKLIEWECDSVGVKADVPEPPAIYLLTLLSLLILTKRFARS